MAFKTLCAFDPELIHATPRLTKEQKAMIRDLPILGVASRSAAIHDVAAVKVVGDEVGAHVLSTAGNPRLPITKGEHGIIVANNRRNARILVHALR